MAEHEDLRKRKDFDKHKDPEERLAPPKTDPEVASQPVLPRDVFPNKFSFFLYFFIQNPLVWISLVSAGTFLFGLIASRFEFWVALWSLTSIVLGFITLSIPLMDRQSGIDVLRKFRLEQETQFLIEIRDVKPGMDVPKWDIVASRMNDYLLKTGHYFGKYAFYDGHHCFNAFKKGYLLSRKEAFDVTPSNDSAYGVHGGVDYFKRQVSRDYYNSHDEHLVKAYEEGLKFR